jgi:hypothetical protein
MGREHQARGTEGSRTHYFPDRGTRWSKGQQRFWFKHETRRRHLLALRGSTDLDLLEAEKAPKDAPKVENWFKSEK